jgi:predicted SAM-dependent methyltransferase
MKLNLGCGTDVQQGYTNIDAVPQSPDVIQGNILSLDLEDGVADEVMSSHVVEHLTRDELDAFFQECRRLLKPGGTLVCVAPDMEAWCRAWARNQVGIDELDNLLYALQKHEYDYHRQGIYEKKLRMLCERHNFEVISLQHVFAGRRGALREVHLRARKPA